MKRACCGVILCALAGNAAAQTAITYQGLLTAGGQNAAGLYDLRFRLYDQAVGGNQVGAVLCADDLSVVDGRFTVSLDFGAVYTGARYLEIDVRPDAGLGCGAGAGYTMLAGRQALTPAPSATYAPAAGDAGLLGGQPGAFYRNAGNLTGTVSDALLSGNIPRLNFASTFTAIPAFNGGTSGGSAPFSVDSTFKVGNLNADLLDGLDSAAFAAASHTHDAGAVVSGTLGDARLSANIARLSGNQSWTGSNVFTGANSFAGDGSGLTSLNAGQLVSGQVPDSRLPSTVARLASANTFTAAQTVNAGGVQTPLTLTGSNTQGTWMTINNTAARAWNIIATSTANGEGAGKLVFRDATAGQVRMTLDTAGQVGIGTSTPAGRLDVTAADPRVALRNANDPGGGYLQQSFGTLQLGLYNPGATAWNAVPAGGFRAGFGVDSTGRVGSLTNTGIAPAFRNVLDDGGGNASIQGTLTAANMPAIKYGGSQTSGSLESGSATLIESFPITVPANGHLRISVRASIELTAYDSQTAIATLELKETTSGETTVKQSVHSISPGSTAITIQSWRGDVTLEHCTPTGAGPRTFKVRLLFTDNNGISLNRVAYYGSEITVEYFPSSL